MTDKVYTYLFRLLNQETAILITKYEGDETTLSNLYEAMLLDAGDNDNAFINYITQLLSFLEKKEDYERCAKLLKLKNKIKEY